MIFISVNYFHGLFKSKVKNISICVCMYEYICMYACIKVELTQLLLAVDTSELRKGGTATSGDYDIYIF